MNTIDGETKELVYCQMLEHAMHNLILIMGRTQSTHVRKQLQELDDAIRKAAKEIDPQ